MAVSNAMDIYQLKISLKRFKPPIWRRVQMPKDSTFQELHFAVVSCMSWSNMHLHVFREPRSRQRGYDEEREDLEIGHVSKDKKTGEERAFSRVFKTKRYNEKMTKLCDYFKAPKDVIDYDYDLGDTWEHVIVLEKILPRVAGKEYPICVAGKRGHPPEHTPTYEEEEDYDSDGWEDEVFDHKSVTFKRYED